MSWRAHATAGSQATQTDKFNAPLFRSLVEKLATRERWVVLDLGAARTQTVELLGKYGCRLDIANVSDGLDALNAIEEPERLMEAAEALLPVRNAEATDVVLCWDLLNYLKRPALRALMSCIARRTQRDSLIHALIAYTHAHMPVNPGSYIPDDDNNLLDIADHSDECPAPRYSPEDLTQCLPDFRINRAMLLSNGMQEFLFSSAEK